MVWEELGRHRGQIAALKWTASGDRLLSGSSDGDIRTWTEKSFEQISADVTDAIGERDFLLDLAWLEAPQSLLIAFGGRANRYAIEDGKHILLPEIRSVTDLTVSPTGDYLASREMVLDSDRDQVVPRLRVRPVEDLSQPPIVDSDVFSRNNAWHYDLAWHPRGGLLAILSGSEVHFASMQSGRLLSESWWVGRFANALAWISDDEIAIAFGDANVRIYPWQQSRRYQANSSFSPDAKLILERHNTSVGWITSGCNSDVFATLDTDGVVHLWSQDGRHITTEVAPSVDEHPSTRLALHPRAPVLAISRSNRVYRSTFAPSPPSVGTAASLNENNGILAGLFRRAALIAAEQLDSDIVRAHWRAPHQTDSADETIKDTLSLRKIALLTTLLASRAVEAMQLLWPEDNQSDAIELENLDIETQGSGPVIVERLRDGMRVALVKDLTGDVAQRRDLAVCAYTSLGYLDKSAQEELSGFAGYIKALDNLQDADFRRKLKACRVRAAEAKTASDIAEILEVVHSAVATALERLRATADRNQSVASKVSPMRDIIVAAARQELDAIRRTLRELNIPYTRSWLGKRPMETFQLSDTYRGSITIGVMLPLQKGKTETKSLLEDIKNHSEATNVLMIGMMGGIKGKTKLLDVIVPSTIYDATGIGTKDGKFVVEPQAGQTDAALHNTAAFIDSAKLREPGINIISHKNSLTFAAKIDDIKQKLAAAALDIDRENIIGLEMEGSALVEMQTRNFELQDSRYLMIKGVADYAGELPDAAEVNALNEIPGVRDHLPNPDPTKSSGLKGALQFEATRRAFIVSLEVLRTVPPGDEARRLRQ